MKGYFCEMSLTGLCEAAGGIEAWRRISKRFHHKVEKDPLVRGLFPKDMRALEERLALFLAEWTGGSPEYTSKRGKASLFCRHAHLAIGTLHAERWLHLMSASLAEEGVSETISSQLMADLATVAATLADPFVALYRMPLEALREKLLDDPSLATANDRGRNLICAAAIYWDVARLRLLLEFGADVEMTDGGGHNPLYRVANGSGHEEDGLESLLLLIEHGARVNQVTGVGGMTPLHMAARRGNVAIAEVLLAAGADIEARDSKGESPLRRAVNCGKEGIVRLLLTYRADPLSRDRMGLTVFEAARMPSIRKLLGEALSRRGSDSREDMQN